MTVVSLGCSIPPRYRRVILPCPVRCGYDLVHGDLFFDCLVDGHVLPGESESASLMGMTLGPVLIIPWHGLRGREHP